MGKDRKLAAPGKMGSGWILKIRYFVIQLGISIGVSGVAAFLFYNSLWALFSLPVIFIVVGKFRKEAGIKQFCKRLNLEFKDYMYAVSGALMAGYSVERAFLTGLGDMRQLYGGDSVLVERLSTMEKRLGVQEPIEHILCDFAEESGCEDIENFVEIFCYAKRGGGDFVHIIATTVGRICDKIEVLEEIHTVMAEKALEQKVMCVVPIGILCFFRLTSPEFIGQLYGNFLGIGIMTVALLLYGAAFFMGLKIVEVEV